MSLGPWIVREPGDEIPVSDRVIYLVFVESLERPSRTTPERAILRAAQRCGVSRQRVLDVVRSINKEHLP